MDRQDIVAAKTMIPVTSIFPSPADMPPTLLVVIDTEEEFDWNTTFDRGSTSVDNIGSQHLAQDLFTAAGIVPTYAIDYPVATTPSSPCNGPRGPRICG